MSNLTGNSTPWEIQPRGIALRSLLIREGRSARTDHRRLVATACHVAEPTHTPSDKLGRSSCHANGVLFTGMLMLVAVALLLLLLHMSRQYGTMCVCYLGTGAPMVYAQIPKPPEGFCSLCL